MKHTVCYYLGYYANISAHLVVASMLVEQRDDGFNVPSLDDVQSLWAFYQDTVEDFQDS